MLFILNSNSGEMFYVYYITFLIHKTERPALTLKKHVSLKLLDTTL